MLTTFHPPLTYKYHKRDAEGGNEIDLGIRKDTLKERANNCVCHKVKWILSPGFPGNNGYLLTGAEDSRTETRWPTTPSPYLVHPCLGRNGVYKVSVFPIKMIQSFSTLGPGSFLSLAALS